MHDAAESPSTIIQKVCWYRCLGECRWHPVVSFSLCRLMDDPNCHSRQPYTPCWILNAVLLYLLKASLAFQYGNTSIVMACGMWALPQKLTFRHWHDNVTNSALTPDPQPTFKTRQDHLQVVHLAMYLECESCLEQRARNGPGTKQASSGKRMLHETKLSFFARRHHH